MSVLYPKPTPQCSQFFFVLSLIAVVVSFATRSEAQTAPTNIQISGSVLQTPVHRFGVNLSDQTYWDSGQMLKNLVFQNPGFEGLKYRSILKCSVVTANTCMDDNQYSTQPTGYWTGGTYEILSGNSAGLKGIVAASTQNPTACSGCGQIIKFDQNVNVAVGDYFAVTNFFSGNGDAGWWDNISGGGTISTETTDISPNSPGKQALLLTASGAKQSVSVTQYFDSFKGLSFIQLNGAFQVTFRAKGAGGTNKLNVSVQRLQSSGAGPYLNQTLTLTNSWQDYTLSFSANENGSAVGTVQLVFAVTGANVELDDVSMEQTNSSASNTTAFRDDVVNALKELNPGTIRMMAAGAALGSDIPNQLATPFARYRGGFNSTSTQESAVAYGIDEFMHLCAAVGADPWITIPTATTPEEMTDLMEYLTGNGSDSFSASRIARGQVQPWTTVFNKIHLELGNETWNGTFKGESMAYPGYPQWANQVFGAARQTPGFVASKFDMVLDGWAAVPGYNTGLLTYSTQHDSIDIAPYLLYGANNEPLSTMYGALFAEPEMFESPGGEVYQDMQAAAVAPHPTSVNVYETNLGTMVGTITQAQLDLLTPSVGAGIAHADHMLQMMRSGIQYQNAFALPQYEYLRSDQSNVRLWGLVVDMGTTNRRRPEFLTQALANSVVAGNMLATTQTGSNPTWNQPLSSDNVVLNGAHFIQSFAFLNGSAASTVLFNLSQTTALPIVFSGPNAPTGTVHMSQITSANITDSNEFANNVQTTTQTLSAFNSATGLSLPPFSMTVLSWDSTIAQAPQFSLPEAAYSTTQSVSIIATTPGSTIYYTTDGSIPTAASMLYMGPITVSKTQTVEAIAVAANFTNSPVATATYTIQPVAATPVFSLAVGTYNSGQTVSLADQTPGASIYYTIDGSTPTTASNLYTGPITVSKTETLKAIAAAPNYTNSLVAGAVYTIAPPAPAPTFSVSSGTYTTPQSFAMSDSMAGAVIYYTNDGTTPTTSSTRYTSLVTVSAAQTVIKAIAIATGYSSSPVTSATYVISARVALPALSVAGGTYNTAQTVAVSVVTPGAKIYYTTDQSAPTTSSPVYTAPIAVTSCKYLQAIAMAPGYTVSFTQTAMYNLTVGTPVLSVASGTYDGPQTVTITDVTPDANLFYTTNGKTPTTGSTSYTGPFTVSASESVQVIGTKAGFVNSAVGSATYVIGSATATPSFSVVAGTYSAAQNVTISDATVGAKIYYTTNGTAPTTTSAVYSGSIAVSATETLEAIAVATGHGNSTVAIAAYTITPPTTAPAFSVASGNYASTQTIVMTDSTAGAKIYYTTDGTAPTTSSAVYSGPITVGVTQTLQAIAVATGHSSSPVEVAVYTITLPALAPVFSLASGTYTTSQTVTVTDLIPGAIVYYTTNGTTPTTASTVYSAPIVITTTETVKAIAVALTFAASPVTTAVYTINDPLTTTIAFPNGFAPKQLTPNGSAALAGNVLQLTNGGTGQAGTAWYPNKVSIDSFVTDFDFQLPTSTADGFTFTIQNAPKGIYALGGNGSGLGYQGIASSVTVAFNLYESGATNAQSVGVYTAGVSPQSKALNLIGTGLNLHSGDVIHANMNYDGTTLKVTLTDNTANVTVTDSFAVNIPGSVGGTTAYVGFTGSTGGFTAIQNILNWTLAN